MALTDQNREYLYLALGLRAEGGARYRVRWNFFTTFSIPKASIDWDTSTAKALIDKRIGFVSDPAVSTLSAAALTELGTLLDTYRTTRTSSFEMRGEVNLSDPEENRLAQDAIYRMVGIEIEEVGANVARPMNEVNGSGESRSGRLTR
jgi:hypothetical protein